MRAWLPDIYPSAGNVMSPPVRPMALSSFNSKGWPRSRPSTISLNRPFGGGGSVIISVWENDICSPHFSQKSRPALFSCVHLGQMTGADADAPGEGGCGVLGIDNPFGFSATGAGFSETLAGLAG